MAADPLDIITAEEAEGALNQQGGASVVTLQAETKQQLVTAVSRRIDALCGPVVVRTVNELHDGGTRYPTCSIRLRKLAGGNGPKVASITSVTEYVSTTPTVLTVETNATKPNAGYILDDDGYLIRRAGGADTSFATGRQNIAVVYQAGRYATIAAVDPQFKKAAQTLFAHWWRIEHGVGSRFGDTDLGVTASGVPTFDVPNSVRGLLADQLLHPGIA